MTVVGPRPSEALLGEPGRGWRIQSRYVDEARRRSSDAAAGRIQAVTRTGSYLIDGSLRLVFFRDFS